MQAQAHETINPVSADAGLTAWLPSLAPAFFSHAGTGTDCVGLTHRWVDSELGHVIVGRRHTCPLRPARRQQRMGRHVGARQRLLSRETVASRGCEERVGERRSHLKPQEALWDCKPTPPTIATARAHLTCLSWSWRGV